MRERRPEQTLPVPDAEARRLAETTFDRNVVVIAGAGTGKTTLLVNRILNVLLREPAPVPITQLVALTFTNKAAAEMKIRLRERLQALLAPEAAHNRVSGAVSAEDLRERYGLTTDRIVERAAAALHDLEKAQIGTLHSFAAHLLRLYPIESGVDPLFMEDEGDRFAEYFSAQWEAWLDGELGRTGADRARWRLVLQAVGLDELRDVAEALASELIELPDLTSQVERGDLGPPLRHWFADKRSKAEGLLASHPDGKKPLKVAQMLAAARDLFGLLIEQGGQGLEAFGPAGREWLGKDAGREAPKSWSAEDFAEARRVVESAQRLLTVDQPLMADLLRLLRPFAERVRAGFVADGWLSFDGLLARARTLLRDHPRIRERLKHEYRAILVDEFQDTDPVQYEIVLFLSERSGSNGTAWQAVALEPGKLFIVGDPKQSIYAFRRADIEAFERVVEKVESAGGSVLKLETNFRSHGAVLDAVNAVFDRLFTPQEHLQPPNVPLLVQPGRRGGSSAPGASFFLVGGGEDEREVDAAAATRAEAETLARWIKEELLARDALTDAQGWRQPLKPGQVALLFRKLTQAQDYLDALRRHDIPYVTDGEKHYYRRQEVIDLVNLVRVLENPLDRIALVGLLRSPLGGVTDRELVELYERHALDYRLGQRLTGWGSPRAAILSRLYTQLTELARVLPSRPLPDAIHLLFERLPLLEIAASSLHGEQAVANLLKVRHMASELADRPHLGLGGFVDLMVGRLAEQPEEAESALAEESLKAVRVLTIHKAKGLEFPVVILAGLHHGTGPIRRVPLVSQDWSTGLVGLVQGERCSLGAVVTREKGEAREAVERRRLLYVGMTRARERLILSGGLPSRVSRDSLLALVREAVDGEVGKPEDRTCRIGPISVEQHVVSAADRRARRKGAFAVPRGEETAGADVVRHWRQRDEAWAAACLTPRELTPTQLLQRQAPGAAGTTRGEPREAELSRLIGTLAHLVLQEWDFSADPAQLPAHIDRICRKAVPAERMEDTERIRAELQELLAGLAVSAPYADLRRAEILGREVPFAIPWDGGRRPDAPGPRPSVMQGSMDLLFRLDGEVWIADYKTDRVAADEVQARAEAYRVQAQVYRDAVASCLGIGPVRFQFVFLRSGVGVKL
ncbi:MAG: UvrD-helicase domain-containing protein [Nitrospirota bacterium]|nr:UvrD-helicase domain-containing protein [Nitrospirota bacterium]